MPTGTLLINPKRGRKSTKSRKSGKSVRSSGLSGLLRKLTGGGRKSRKNPILIGNPRRSSRIRVKSYTRSRGKSRSSARKNPILLSNHSATLSRVSRSVGKLPLVGGLLGGAVAVLGSALGGAIGVLPISYAMPYIGKYMPEMAKPLAYTIAGVILSSAVRLLPVKLPYKSELAIGIAAAGGAVDAYRFRAGKSYDLGDDGYDDLGEDDMGYDDLGDLGNDGSALAAVEFADADLRDADYSGEDFSDAELASLELGRPAFWKRWRAGKASAAVADDGASAHAGKPGLRWGWLIYWIGADNTRRIAALPENERREAIQHMRREAKLRSRKLLAEGSNTTIQQAETAGLLVAA